MVRVMRTTRAFLCGFGGAVLLLLSGCGGGGSASGQAVAPPPPPPPSVAPDPLAIRMDQGRTLPPFDSTQTATVQAPAGTSVTWSIQSSDPAAIPVGDTHQLGLTFKTGGPGSSLELSCSMLLAAATTPVVAKVTCHISRMVPLLNVMSDRNAGSLLELHRGPNAGSLIAIGGYTFFETGGTEKVDIYDPARDRWRPATPASTPRGEAAVVELADGRILTTGGRNNADGPLKSVEIYNPTSDTWADAAAMSEARYGHTATLLPDGRVLVVGGGTNSPSELYDPNQNKWSKATGLPEMRFRHTAMRLKDGRVLVAGGAGSNGFLKTAALFLPSTNQWSNAPSMATSRASHTATLLPNGKVLITGGYSGDLTSQITSSELFDPATESWAATGSLGEGRYAHSATLLENGKVLVAGGHGSGPGSEWGYSRNSELYDPGTGEWMTTNPMNRNRSAHLAIRLSTGKVLVCGGANQGTNLSSTESFDPATSKWTLAAEKASSRESHTVTPLPDGRFLVAGGAIGMRTLGDCEILDVATRGITLTGPMSAPRSGHQATRLNDGRVLATGGWKNETSGLPIRYTELFDPASGAWSPAGDLVAVATANAAIRLADGRVFVIGTRVGDGMISAAGDLYDPSTGAWSEANYHGSHVDGVMTLLPDNRVLILGGEFDKSVEIWDPVTGNIQLGEGMATFPQSRAVVPLLDGRIMVCGWGGNSSTEFFDPRTLAWSIGPSMVKPTRIWSQGIRLQDGRVLVTGGGDSIEAYRDAEVYDPQTNQWTATSPMAFRRNQHRMLLLPDGRVLIHGGAFAPVFGISLAEAELFIP